MAIKSHTVQDPNRFKKIVLPAGTKLVNATGPDLVIEISDTYEVSEAGKYLIVEPTEEALPVVNTAYSMKDVTVRGGVSFSGIKVGSGPVVDFKSTAYVPATFSGQIQVG